MDVYKLNGYSYVTIAKINKDEVEKVDFDLCQQPTETLDKYYKRQTKKPNILVNAGFFNMADGSTIFTVVNENVLVHGEDWVSKGIGILNDKDVRFGDVKETSWRDFISAYPPLIVNGTKYNTSIASSLNYKARRTVFGFNNNYFFVICVDNPGMNFAQLQNLCLNLGCTYAVNFDGGGSTRMLVDGVRKTSLTSNRPVDTVLAIYLKDKTKEVNYYVTTTTSALNVRSKPTTASDNISMLRDMKVVHHIILESEDGKWGYVENLGWIYLYYTKRVVNTAGGTIKPSTSQNTFKEYKVVITTASLRVREKPTTLSAKLGNYYKGNVVTILEEKNNWGRTYSGWIYLPLYTKKQ